ncbi:SAR2788 family putative toxin [Bacillus altitudinis]|uniref:SAR2788 family putative toxin n=1 Tax=Bacillus altitudinis TaxID=293387 RepID=UPI002281A1EB|nr:SAR2788 family putative toxin [Bacillus altitudinis]MCY7686000.1 SAR2788 family putative toxin [Bacillus altitudinis]MCY7702708.1 SAR2788 family putative toxin [Bacillus altitudinis]
MKKVLIKVLVLTLFLCGVVPEFASAKSGEIDSDALRIEENASKEYEVNVEKELGIELEQDMLMEVKESPDEVNVYTQLEAESMNVQTDMKINHETGEITVDGITELENGEKETNKFNVLIEEIEGNDFTATFVDDETGKEYKVSTIEAQSSIVPAIIVGIVSRFGIQYAIKKYGKKLIIKTFKKQVIKQGIKKVSKFSVSNKHLSNAKGRYRKFNTTSKSTVNKWIKEALQSKNVSFTINNNKKLSFVITANLKKKIGTKGETKIKIVIGWDGKIWTAYPIK